MLEVRACSREGNRLVMHLHRNAARGSNLRAFAPLTFYPFSIILIPQVFNKEYRVSMDSS